MPATISIETSSFQRMPDGGQRKISLAEIVTLSSACAHLLENLGKVGDQVEVIKVASWHAYGQPNIFVIKAILSMHGEGPVKIEVQKTFEHHARRGLTPSEWDLDNLTKRILDDMPREIYQQIKNRMHSLKQMRARWEKILPQDDNT